MTRRNKMTLKDKGHFGTGVDEIPELIDEISQKAEQQ
jgi:hypothetical protein